MHREFEIYKREIVLILIAAAGRVTRFVGNLGLLAGAILLGMQLIQGKDGLPWVLTATLGATYHFFPWMMRGAVRKIEEEIQQLCGHQ
jgi:hypothetical protein